MDDFITKLIEKLAKGRDITELIRKYLEDAINKLLDVERTVFLGYESHEVDGYNSGNSRNGYYERELKTQFGVLKLRIPRDRNGMFDPKAVRSYTENSDRLEETIKLFYCNGITTREISEIIDKMYGHHYSPQTISNISDVLVEELENYKKRPITAKYVALFCDATFIPVRRGTVSKEAVHVIIGITEEGHKEVVDFAVYPTESANNYREMLRGLKKRGLKDVLLFVSDELTGLADALTDEFPKARHQSCWTHVLRSAGNKVRLTDRQEVMNDLKQVHKQTTIEDATIRLKGFLERWGEKYPKVRKGLEGKTNLFTYLSFPESIRPSIYTNNISEGFNKQLKRKTKVKEQFPNEKSLEKHVFIHIVNTNVKYGTRIHKGFKQARFELMQMFDDPISIWPSKKISPPSGGEPGGVA